MKRFLIIILALALLLCGCGKERNEAPEALENPTAAPTVPATAGDEEIPEGQEAVTAPAKQTETVYRAVRMSLQDSSGNEIGCETYTYDTLGRCTGSQEFDAAGNLTASTVTVYAENGDYETTYSSGGSDYTVRYTCDEAGNVIKDETVENGEVVDYNLRSFDQYGNQLKLETSFGTFLYEYTYDDSGNVLKRLEYQEEELMGWLEMTYDDQGRASASVYYDPSGEASYSTTVQWEGNTETRTYRDSDGSAYLVVIETYDDLGNTRFRETWQGDVVISRVEYTYEPVEIFAE